MSASTAPAEQVHATDEIRALPATTPRRSLPSRLLGAVHRPYLRDLGCCLLFLIFAGWLTHGLWPDPTGRVLALNPNDQALYEWFIAYDTRLLFDDFSLVTDRLNAPEGVNLLANTSIIAIGGLLAPVTVAFGAPVTFALVVAANLGLTAIAWFLLLTRTFAMHRLAAAVGAAFCGFAPAMISQSNAHLHMTAQFLVPAMVWCVVRIARNADPDLPLRIRTLVLPAVLLAALVTVQVFIGEEVLFLTALTMVLVTLGYALVRPSEALRLAPRFLTAMLLATGLASIALAYPLWVQFAGPQHVPNGPFSPAYFSADLASFTAFSPLSIGGSADNARLSTGAAEYNTFLGWPLLLVAVACVVWLRRRPLVWALAIAAVVMAWLSLGPRLVLDGDRTDIPGLYVVLHGLPVVDGALPMRFAIALVPLIALLLGFGLDRVLRSRPGDGLRITALAVVAVALLPLLPRPLPTTDRAPVPAFISQGHWQRCVEPGGVLVPVPLPTPPAPDPMRWAAATNVGFGLPEGFFIGPYAPGGRASVGTFAQQTSWVLGEVARTGEVPAIGEGQREQARKDLAYWGSSCVVLTDHPRRNQLRATLEALFGPGEQAAGTWFWKVKPSE